MTQAGTPKRARPATPPLRGVGAPPSWIRILGWLLPRAHRASVLGDLDELYRLRRRTRGRARAALWYGRALLGYLPRLALARARPVPSLPDTLRPRRRRQGPATMIDSLLRDLRFALRSLRRNPLFAGVAILTLGLGVGVNSAVFTLVNTILLRPLPVAEPERLVEIYSLDPQVEIPVSSSWPDYLDLRDGVASLEDIAGHSAFAGNLTEDGRSELLYGEMVTGNYFDLLGIRSQIGRTIDATDVADPGNDTLAVLGHGFWQRRFGGDPGVVGRAVRINGMSFTVVGVASADFTGMVPGFAADLWIPATMGTVIDPIGIQSVDSRGGRHRLEQRGNRWLLLKGRRAPGSELERVRAEVAARMQALEAQYPDTNARWGSHVLPASAVRIHPAADSALAPAAGLLLAIVGLVLLIACANLAGMTLSRATARQQEIAVRLALGAGRRRLVRQLVTESLLLGAIGGTVGLILAVWSSRALAAFQPPLPFALRLDLGIDGAVIAFTFTIALAAGLVSGLAPALRASRPGLVDALRDGSRAAAAERGGLRAALVVAQVAISTVLVVGAVLLGRSAVRAERIDVGFRTTDVAAFTVDLSLHRYSPEEARAFFERAVERLGALPGVEGVTLASRMPLALSINANGVYLDGHQESDADSGYPIDTTSVDGAYFDVLGIELLAGRLFDARDTPESPRVAIVSASMADRYWPRGDAIGQRFRTGGFDGTETEIVGIAADYRVRTVGEEPRPYIHYARRQSSSGFATIAALTPTGPAGLHDAMVTELRTLEPELVLIEDTTLDGLVRTALFPVRMGAWAFGTLASVAAGLAGLGLYGVIAYAVGRRTREIGLRMAVGARGGDVLRLVFRQGMGLVLLGLGAGLVAAAAAARAVSDYLYGVGVLDPVAFAAAPGLLLAVAACATLIPARRALTVDPVVALRDG